MKKTRFADGTGSGTRTQIESACVRAIDAYVTLERRADRVLEALDDITIPGVVRHAITEEDSLVIAIKDVTGSPEGSNPVKSTLASGKKPEIGG